jgi:3-hydroxybutyryl-CoA dehydrogenase
MKHQERVAILGAGTMGQGIAQLTAMSGHATCLFDAIQESAAKAARAVAGALARQVEKGKMAQAEREATEGRLKVCSSLEEACAGATVVIEAVPERMELKVEVLGAAARHAAAGALLASNTSALSITELGHRLGAEERTVGLHFFNPPVVMELLEIVRGLGTSDATMARAEAFARGLGKTPIFVRDSPGFATSRLGVVLGAEAMRMLETNVASAEDIDRALELGYRHPMGPLKLTDLVGLDVRLTILENLHKELGEQFRPPAILRTLVRAGKLGKKTGEGFYLWKDGQPQAKPGRSQ